MRGLIEAHSSTAKRMFEEWEQDNKKALAVFHKVHEKIQNNAGGGNTMDAMQFLTNTNQYQRAISNIATEVLNIVDRMLDEDIQSSNCNFNIVLVVVIFSAIIIPSLVIW